jgi:hypothetical protein
VTAIRGAALAVALAAPVAALALEPRFDHRDQQGPLAELVLARDTVAISGKATRSSWRPAVRLAWTYDFSGEGDELHFGVESALGGTWDDPERQHVLLAGDVRYRAYFGLDEWKTFFDLGLWLPVRSRVAIGPQLGIGAMYDLGRSGGIYATLGFGTGLGQARIASFTGAIGAQFRFE